MDIKLFLSTFALIFLAELGDKTQLAALASSAGSRSPLSVFAGAASALVLSTLIAVLMGSTLQRFLPQHYLKAGAAVLFFFFGALLMISAVKTARGEPVAIPGIAQQARSGILAHIALTAAREFEEATSIDYASLAASTPTDSLRRLFLHLAEEEKLHLDRISRLLDSHADTRLDSSTAPSISSPLPGGGGAAIPASRIISAALNHEYDSAKFYEALARTVPLQSVKTALASLAEEEHSHIAHLEEFVRSGTFFRANIS